MMMYYYNNKRASILPVSETVPFLESTNVIFMGSNVVDGSGVGIVIATGADNQVSQTYDNRCIIYTCDICNNYNITHTISCLLVG